MKRIKDLKPGCRKDTRLFHKRRRNLSTYPQNPQEKAINIVDKVVDREAALWVLNSVPLC
ncbi:hypothetical protein J2S20_000830 [Moryella indoligenes]|uniref:Uncharacterized protein n=1 Tax=Moryella indoligenes TaxID=371674 RepID=A0AAE3V9M4_9FIRM|nr:hypothetical protein [Moryella indoligenes]MDQ0152145.1 hypothetical protein [Moryella indoligenes]